jgi:hypothetical protein
MVLSTKYKVVFLTKTQCCGLKPDDRDGIVSCPRCLKVSSWDCGELGNFVNYNVKTQPIRWGSSIMFGGFKSVKFPYQQEIEDVSGE